MKKNIAFYALLIANVSLCFPALAQTSPKKSFGEIAKEESITPIRPGVPGKTPFWNANAHQFIYAPAFEYKIVPGASKYRYDIKTENNGILSFETNVPYSPLSKVWASMPTGFFNLQVTALNSKGESIGTAGNGKYYKAAYFNGPYHTPVMPYDESAKIALDNLLHKDYVNYWLTNKVPDPDYALYRYPAKIYSALVVGAVTHARLKKGTADAKRSEELAKVVADYMIGISYPKGSVWEYFVPTYYGPRIPNKPGSHINLKSNFTVMGADAGNAFLDLYDFTKDSKYLDAAKRIADTYLKNQMKNGSWYLYADYQNGGPVAPNISIPTAVINYFDRLRKDYAVKGLEEPTKKAVNWVMENPVKTFNWQAQFEDVKAMPPYKRHSREQACDMAVYLMKNHTQIPLAEELIRFAEDQFVIWEKPLPIIIHDTPDKEVSPGWNSKNWITPSVQEQYGFFMPVSRTAGVMIDTYWQAYATTKKEIYKAKAQSIANALTLVQKEHNGDYPTMFTKYDMNFWLNSVVYPAKVMMDLADNLKK
ncbi:MAG: hypothetical protein K0S09_346 [Sphingobacteriaceae bacterium]|jgi:maltose/maltodextrin transport system substrate-binding protein|nr:hypothetical protein [Sphingobacteriaceae bacterium]